MSSNLMNTEVGGEQTQYESVNTFQQPHKKSGGQFGNPETTTDPDKTKEAGQRRSERGERTSQNIRYGQSISEEGMGGMTTSRLGEATNEDRSDATGQDQSESGVQQRRAQGYGGKADMNRDVGA